MAGGKIMPADKLKVLDLFAGIRVGGFSLGLERTGGFETVAFCEIEPYAQKVLAKHWPGVPIYEDVRQLTADRLAGDGIGVDVITGGFPCQDISRAGKQAGIEGERSGLWGELARLIGELRPRYAIMENVSALLSGDSGRWFGRVIGDLAEIGYDAEWHCIPASELGAHHHRDRVWILAYAHAGQRFNAQEKVCTGRHASDLSRTDLANANGHRPQRITLDRGDPKKGRGVITRCALARAGDTHRGGIWGSEPELGRVVARLSPELDGSGGLDEYARTVASAQGVTTDTAVDGLLRELRRYGESGEASSLLRGRDVLSDPLSFLPQRLAQARASGGTDEELRSLWDEVSSKPLQEAQDVFKDLLERAGKAQCKKALGQRTDRLRCLGNAVVPQIPELIGRAILSAEREG